MDFECCGVVFGMWCVGGEVVYVVMLCECG